MQNQQSIIGLYNALLLSNDTITSAKNENDLFAGICQNILIVESINMVWIGLADTTSQKLIPVAHAGEGKEYIKEISISIGDNEFGNGPSGLAYKTGTPYWTQDFTHNQHTSPWRKSANKYHWKSSAALPIAKKGKTIGTLNIYSIQANVFDDNTKVLLEKMASNINHALDALENEKARVEAENELQESYNLLTSIINSLPTRIFWKDKNLTYIGCNTAFANDAGKDSSQDIIGKNDHQMPWKDQADLYNSDDKNVINSQTPKLFFEEPQTTPEGQLIWLRTSKVPLRNSRNEIIGIIGLYDDITEQKRSEERIQFLANNDALTELPNRASLEEKVEYNISLSERNGLGFALMFLDIDNFKDINDTLGHAIGDRILVNLSKRLKKVLRHEDTLARFGGDEFVILLPNTNDIEAQEVAKKLLYAIHQPCSISHHKLTITVSIGISIYPNDGLDKDSLYKNADTALYRSKLNGKNNYSFFTQEMQTLAKRNLELSNALHNAIRNNELYLTYQPQISAIEQKLVGAEALLRWKHPELGQISPAEFIPIAETNGLIISIGEWVMKNAVRQLKSWMDQGFSPFTMSVNLSAVQFNQANLSTKIEEVLKSTYLPAKYLELELTESVIMSNANTTIAIMDKLHQLGLKMSIDDFGTGYSSLSYLKKFRVHKLKIDQSFIRDITTDPEDKAIVQAIINMAKTLGLSTIAEGVETSEQLKYLQENGCDIIQGFYYNKPLEAKEFEEQYLQPKK